MAAESLEDWLSQRLNNLIGSGRDVAQYWLSMDLEDLEHYLQNCYPGQVEILSLFDEIKRRKDAEAAVELGKYQAQLSAVTGRAGGWGAGAASSGKKNMPTRKQQAQAFVDSQTGFPSTSKKNNQMRDGAGVKWNMDGSTKRSRKQKKKRLDKGDPVFVKERRRCGCQGVVHPAVELGNCTDCGYIFCIQEGFGECFFCGAMVSKEGTVSRRSETHQSPDSTKSRKAKAKATLLRDQLLEYQDNKAQRTVVIDDQMDFWDEAGNDMWLSKEEREYAQKKSTKEIDDLHRSRADRKIELNLDFNAKGKGFTEAKEATRSSFETRDKDRKKATVINPKEKEKDSAPLSDAAGYFNNTLDGHAREVYENLKRMMLAQHARKKAKLSEETREATAPSGRLQDGDIYETTEHTAMINEDAQIESDEEEESPWGHDQDKGVCLSMHQPWASLLVKGIKRVEGRSWETKYRGRLWIAAARRVPTQMEIDELESMYCEVYGLPHDEIPFPKTYPTSALLGCIDVIDCLDNETYCNRPDSREDNSSSYIFICKMPRVLFLPGQISGNHKLWRMPQQRLKAVQSGLMKVDRSWLRESTHYKLIQQQSTEEDL